MLHATITIVLALVCVSQAFVILPSTTCCAERSRSSSDAGSVIAGLNNAVFVVDLEMRMTQVPLDIYKVNANATLTLYVSANGAPRSLADLTVIPLRTVRVLGSDMPSNGRISLAVQPSNGLLFGVMLLPFEFNLTTVACSEPTCSNPAVVVHAVSDYYYGSTSALFSAFAGDSGIRGFVRLTGYIDPNLNGLVGFVSLCTDASCTSLDVHTIIVPDLASSGYTSGVVRATLSSTGQLLVGVIVGSDTSTYCADTFVLIVCANATCAGGGSVVFRSAFVTASQCGDTYRTSSYVQVGGSPAKFVFKYSLSQDDATLLAVTCSSAACANATLSIVITILPTTVSGVPGGTEFSVDLFSGAIFYAVPISAQEFDYAFCTSSCGERRYFRLFLSNNAFGFVSENPSVAALSDGQSGLVLLYNNDMETVLANTALQNENPAAASASALRPSLLIVAALLAAWCSQLIVA